MRLSPLQRFVVHNECQGDDIKVLAVCSVGILRSPTIAHCLQVNHGMNARSVGLDPDALIPITPLLVFWSDLIVFADQTHRMEFQTKFKKYHGEVFTLSIPDIYNRMEPELIELINNKINSEEFDEIIRRIKNGGN